MSLMTDSAFYILHSRPYQETSVILDAFTWKTGRLSILAKGAKRRSRQWQACLHPFILLQGQWQGRSDLQTLTEVSIVQQHRLQGRSMLMGFYVNELMVRLLQKHAPCPEVFERYHWLLQETITEARLRYFEKDLLDLLGYGFSCQYEAETGELIQPGQSYYFQLERGFVYPSYSKTHDILVEGDTIEALDRRSLASKQQQRQAKYVLRHALKPLLGSRPLHSRQLFYNFISKSD